VRPSVGDGSNYSRQRLAGRWNQGLGPTVSHRWAMKPPVTTPPCPAPGPQEQSSNRGCLIALIPLPDAPRRRHPDPHAGTIHRPPDGSLILRGPMPFARQRSRVRRVTRRYRAASSLSAAPHVLDPGRNDAWLADHDQPSLRSWPFVLDPWLDCGRLELVNVRHFNPSAPAALQRPGAGTRRLIPDAPQVSGSP
jgi:hypothetical protein